MKRTILSSLLAISLFGITTLVQGQRGQPAGVGRPSNPGASVGSRPENRGKPESGVSADHRTDASGHAVNPADTHGFKNYGQYVAAQHIAENLSIPGGIDALKALMTGENAVSLGKAIEQLRPELSEQTIQVEVKKAEAAAKKVEAEAKKGGNSTQ